MDNQIEKLNERLDFYMKAYDETSKDLKVISKDKTKLEKEIDTESKNILDETVPTPLDNIGIDTLEKEYQMNLDDVVLKHENIRANYEKEIEKLKADPRYQEYLRLLINDDLKICIDMEKDEVFNYLIDEKFDTDEFRNEPYFELFRLKYQPRLWKFKKIADKKAKEFGIPSFSEMFKLWNGLRLNYKSLIGNKRITTVVNECEVLDNKIKELNVRVENYLTVRRQDIITAIIQRIKLLSVAILDTIKFSNLIPLLERFNVLTEREPGLQERKTTIMNNINTVEKMISLAEKGKLNLDDKTYNEFFNNTNPEKPIFELIGDVEWTDIKKALEDKGIKTTNNKNDYSVVRTKITKDEKDDLLKKFGVKEGEIFYDPSLANKRH